MLHTVNSPITVRGGASIQHIYYCIEYLLCMCKRRETNEKVQHYIAISRYVIRT